jgi:hypothetical protein
MSTERTLLAIDLGLAAGLACFRVDDRAVPRLVWFRSQQFGTITRLKRAIPRVLDECPNLARVVVEGDRHLGELWQKAAEKRGAVVERVAPEVWREALMYARDRRHGRDAKARATELALEIIIEHGAKRPRTPLVDDVAEAICIGAWATLPASVK